MKRRFEVELAGTMTVEVDDEITSDAYPGETMLTAHLNPERFIPGSDLDTAIGARAVAFLWRTRDGWADFPDDAAREVGWVEWSVDQVTETTEDQP